MKVTIKDIAEKAKVSIGTVDRVLHGRGEVSQETQKKVLNIIHEMNYKPDILARILKTKKTFKIAIVIPSPGEENIFWKDPYIGIMDALNDISHFSFAINEFFYNQDDKSSFRDQFEKIFKVKHDALILAPVFYQESTDLLDQCSKAGIPFLVINSNIYHEDQLCFIGQDPFRSGQVAGRLLSYSYEPGRNIMIVSVAREKDNYNHIINREKGFFDFFAKSNADNKARIRKINIDATDDLLIHNYLSAEILRKNKISGIFVTNSRVYLVAKFLEKKNIRDIKLVGYDLIEENIIYMKKGLIDFLISQKPKEQGYRGMISLFNYLVMGRKPESEIYLPIDIITSENYDYYSK